MNDLSISVDQGGADQTTYTIARHSADGTVTILASGTLEEIRNDVRLFMHMFVQPETTKGWYGESIFNALSDWSPPATASALVVEKPALKKPKPWAADRRAQWRSNQTRHGRKR